MPSLSFDSSRVRSKIQTLGGLMIDGPKQKITMAGTHPLKTQSIQRTAFMIRAFWNDTPIEYIDRLRTLLSRMGDGCPSKIRKTNRLCTSRIIR